MGRDIIQLEDAVSTISQEYLLEFTSEYGIPESLHPELPGPADPIVEFPEGKVGVYTKFFEFANFRIPILQFLFDILGHYQIYLSQLSVIGAAKDGCRLVNDQGKTPRSVIQSPLIRCRIGTTNSSWWMIEYSIPSRISALVLQRIRCHQSVHILRRTLISAPNPTEVKTGTLPCTAHEVPLLTATAIRVIDMEDMTRASGSSGTPSTVENLSLDFSNKDPSLLITERIGTEEQGQDELSQGNLPVGNPPYTEVMLEPDLEKETVAMGALMNKRRRKRGLDEAEANAPPKVLRKDHVASHISQSTLRGKSLAVMRIGTGPTVSAPATQKTPVYM
nr:hypothetical protein [Tanacetum cinerariifolium]